jgi:hypothetical protein
MYASRFFFMLIWLGSGLLGGCSIQSVAQQAPSSANSTKDFVSCRPNSHELRIGGSERKSSGLNGLIGGVYARALGDDRLVLVEHELGCSPPEKERRTVAGSARTDSTGSEPTIGAVE